MKKEKLLQLLKDKILVLDGAMGTMLHKKGFTKGCPDELNIKNPDLIKEIHKEYADAGADIIITNTFGANRLKLSFYGLDDKTKEINESAVKIARAAAPNCLIAGNIGPLGKYIEPLDELSFDQAYDYFKEQVLALNNADLLFIETMADIKVLKAALIAAKENSNLPVIVSCTFEGIRTVTGTDVKTYVTIADSLGADIIGSNCSAGPEELYQVAKEMVKFTNKPLLIEPNAGLPIIKEGKTFFDANPEDFRKHAEKFYELGVNIIGGCCGTTPEFIREISKFMKDKKPKIRNVEEKTRFCSRTKTIDIEDKTMIIGERINPTNRKELQNEIINGKTKIIRKEALKQVKEGADLLDINISIAGLDECVFIKKAVNAVQNIVNAPLVIDTSDKDALEAALKECDGKPLINSVNASEKSMRNILPLAKKYGAGIICLAIDKKIPRNVQDRIDMSNRIIKEAENIGIKKNDMIIDCITLTIATNEKNEGIILDSLEKIKELGYKTVLGISNISHGLPHRSEINAKFFTKASERGLDLAIMNPLDNIIQKDTEINLNNGIKIQKKDYNNLSIEKQLHNAILYGDTNNIKDIVKQALEKLKPLDINEILVTALEEVGVKFKAKEYFLPQVLLSAQAMKNAFALLKKEMKNSGGKEKGIIIFATVENDIHDIGKNIVITLLESNNYNVIDLGKSISADKILEAAQKYKPDIIALSALMTTTAIEMEKVIKKLRENNINTPVLVGGAALTEDYAKKIEANYGKDAIDAIKKTNELIQ